MEIELKHTRDIPEFSWVSWAENNDAESELKELFDRYSVSHPSEMDQIKVIVLGTGDQATIIRYID